MSNMLKKQATPAGIHILAEVTLLPSTNENDIFVGAQAMATKTRSEYYFGKALGLGEKATDLCPGLKKGDNIIFNQFAGYALPTEDGYTKFLLASDVVAIVKGKFENMGTKNVKPTKDRILVEIVDEAVVTDNGIYVGERSDSRDAYTQKGKVISCGPDAPVQYKPGTIVCFDPYAGNLILNSDELKLKTIIGELILGTIVE